MTRIIIAVLFGALLFTGVASSADKSPPSSPSDIKAKTANGFAAAGGGSVQAQEVPAGTVPQGVDGSLAETVSTTTASTVCWNTQDLWSSWGTGLTQKVTEYRYWCANYRGGLQTTRTSTVHPSSFYCDWSNPWGAKLSGGNGYTWTKVRTGAHFSCWSGIPLLYYKYDRWQDWSCNTWGNCALTARS